MYQRGEFWKEPKFPFMLFLGCSLRAELKQGLASSGQTSHLCAHTHTHPGSKDLSHYSFCQAYTTAIVKRKLLGAQALLSLSHIHSIISFCITSLSLMPSVWAFQQPSPPWKPEVCEHLLIKTRTHTQILERWEVGGRNSGMLEKRKVKKPEI